MEEEEEERAVVVAAAANLRREKSPDCHFPFPGMRNERRRNLISHKIASLFESF